MSFQADLVWPQYQKFPLDEIRLPLISNVVIFDHEDHTCDFFNLFQLCVHANAKPFTKFRTLLMHVN